MKKAVRPERMRKGFRARERGGAGGGGGGRRVDLRTVGLESVSTYTTLEKPLASFRWIDW